MKIIRLLRQLSYNIIYPSPVKQKAIVLFDAFNGQYACNPKYILLKLHEKAPSLKLNLLISQKHSNEDALPEFVEQVRRDSLKYRLLWRRCNAFVTNGLFAHSEADVASFLQPDAYKAVLKKKLIIATWHGTPLKRIESDIIDWQYPQRDILADFLVAGCRHTADVLSVCNNHEKPFPVSLAGTPRCDILVNGGADVAALKEKLGLPKDKKVFLFAPTFRWESGSDGNLKGNVYESGIRQMEALDIPRVLEALSMRFGGEWVFVYRVHNFVLVEMRERRMELPGVIDGNMGDDMAEYLACADALMTDYSGSLFDFALTRRPCFLFALDREHYEKVERGFYLDYDALPFPFAASCDALIANIKAFDEEAFKAGVEKFLADIGNVEDGRAAERIADCILHYIETGEKRLETVNGVDTR